VDVTEEEMREFIVACDGPQGVSDEEAAEWERLAAGATEGPWVVDQDGSIGAPMAGLVCGEAGHPRPDCSECGTRVCHTSVMPGEPDAAFIAAARTAVPRLLADREWLMAENARMRQVAELRVGTWRDTAARLEGERDRARGTAATLEAENARLREGIEALSAEMQSDTCPACHAFYADEGSTTWGCDHTEGMQHAGDMLRALLADGGDRG